MRSYVNPWKNERQKFTQFVKSITGWIALLTAFARENRRGFLQSARDFLNECDAWFALMQTTQFNESASFYVYEGLAKRHHIGPGDWLADQPDRAALKRVMPLIWFFSKQKDRFPEDTLGHGCAIGLLNTVFKAATAGASRRDIIKAVQAEMNAQLNDASRWQVDAAQNPEVYVN